MPPVGYPGNSVSKAARAKAGGGFESAITAVGLGITGTVAEGQLIAIASDGVNGFGAGDHTVQLFDDHSAGVVGQSQGASDPQIGSYDNTGGPISDVYAHSKGKSVKQFDGAASLYQASWVAIPPSQQVLRSFWVYCPTGKGLPGMDNDSYTPGGSNWKPDWIGAASTSFGTEGEPDICMPTNNNGQNLTIDGNESSMADVDAYTTLSQVHTYGEWFWICSLFDAVNERFIVKHLSKSKGLNQFSFSAPSIWGTTTPQEIGYVRFNSYVRESASANCELYYDDVYVSTGAAAGGLVLIGDAPTFSACTDFSVQRITSRSNTSISVEVKQGPFASLSGKYLFVLDENMVVVPYSGAEGREIQL